MGDFLQRFESFLQKEQLLGGQYKLFLAVSGGIDSVVLCELCHQAGYPFSIAHCNFRLREEESERDEQFVQALAKDYGVEFYLKRFDTEAYREKHKVSVQVAARELRYQWFDELAAQSSLVSGNRVFVATAHHRDDNAETVLMNFFKGTGISGLRGMKPQSGRIIRPLLFAGKEEIVAFAKEHSLAHVEDSSNDTDKYTRNFIRHQVIPLAQKVYPTVLENISDSINHFRDIELLYNQSVESYRKNLLESDGNDVIISVNKLANVNPLETVIYEIFKDYGFTAGQTRDIVALLRSGSGKYVLSSSHRVLRHRNNLILSPLQNNDEKLILISEDHREIDFTGGRLIISQKTIEKDLPQFPASCSIAYLDRKEIEYPLVLRRWRKGDYFYPLGMQKKKKLSRFFIDQKMSLSQKERIWVIEMNGKILWIINHRIDNRFRITSTTKDVLVIALEAPKI